MHRKKIGRLNSLISRFITLEYSKCQASQKNYEKLKMQKFSPFRGGEKKSTKIIP